MALENLGNQEGERRINVKGLAFNKQENVGSGLHFDPESYVTSEVWEKMKKSLDYGEWQGIIIKAFELKYLFSDKAAELGLNEDRKNKVNSVISKGDKLDMSSGQKAALHILFPNFTDTFVKPSENEIKNELKIKYSKLDKVDWVYEFDTDFAALKILYPEILITVGEDNIFESMEKERKSIIEDIKHPFRGYRYVKVTALMRIVKPDWKPDIDEEGWESMIECLKGYDIRGSDYTDDRFIGMLFYMKIIAADKIKFKDNDLEIIMPKPESTFSNSVEQIPNIRNF